jgi:hypothetical protein
MRSRGFRLSFTPTQSLPQAFLHIWINKFLNQRSLSYANRLLPPPLQKIPAHPTFDSFNSSVGGCSDHSGSHHYLSFVLVFTQTGWKTLLQSFEIRWLEMKPYMYCQGKKQCSDEIAKLGTELCPVHRARNPCPPDRNHLQLLNCSLRVQIIILTQ